MLPNTAENLYWQRTPAIPYDARTSLDVPIKRLIDNDRPHSAIRCLSRSINEGKPIEWDQASRALLGALKTTEPVHSTDAHDVVAVIKALQQDPNADSADVLKVEWAYIELLNEANQAAPLHIGRHLAADPEMFCHVIRLVYRARNTPKPVDGPADEEGRMATHGHKLLSEWDTPPGLLEDGGFDGQAFSHWLQSVMQRCAASGHLEVAMTWVGQVLTNAPADPSGLWIHRSAAEALNASDGEEMRRGYSMQLYNSRGYCHYTHGRDERALAEALRTKGNEVETAGFHRLAVTLRHLADGYERDAKEAVSVDPFDD